ncbi:MAG TPA: hypothetical protein VFC45_09075 [Pseudolabrys sp.]|nr:hypothetical protein [Pseudolabrys sp.]
MLLKKTGVTILDTIKTRALELNMTYKHAIIGGLACAEKRMPFGVR